MDCYIYFKASCEHEEEVKRCFLQLRSACEEFGRTPQLQRRPEAKQGLHTWMEIYRNIEPDFMVTLERIVCQSGILRYIDGARHAEYFMQIEPVLGEPKDS